MILTLLLLTVPALANAWTLAVKVVGGTSTNNVVVTNNGATTTFKGTSSYMYPVGPIYFTTATGATVLFDGAAYNAATFVSPVTGNHTLAVTYATTALTSGLDVTQANGGMIYAQNLNNTWSQSVGGLSSGSAVPVIISADTNHQITGWFLNGVQKQYSTFATKKLPLGQGGPAGEVLPLTFPAANPNTTVKPIFGFASKLSAVFYAPTSVVAGKPINLTVTATANEPIASYKITVNGTTVPAATDPVNTTGSFAYLTSATPGNYTITASAITASGATVLATFNSTLQTSVIVAATSATTDLNSTCTSCHTTSTPVVVSSFATNAFIAKNTCISCHGEDTPHEGASCNTCHTGTIIAGVAAPTGHNFPGGGPAVKKCIECHAIAQDLKPVGPHDGPFVNDNNGVRAITTEFAKWSHHVTGVTVDDAHCAACHLEGKVVAGAIVVDNTKHMVDAVTHLRNADTDADFQWDPAAPSHSNMDNFCMSCHDANGATSPMSVLIQGVINTTGKNAAGKTASASNPFGDTISNRYDKMQRPAVVNVSSQFDTTNNSHHGVKGPRYSGRTRAAGPRQIASAATFAANSSALLKGKRSTIYDAGNLNSLYTPLANAAGEASPRTGAADLGDDSTLHCGDCHTVGQWKVGSSETANGSPTPAAIGAHGSNNEYLLRNTLGTDERHTQNAFLQDANNVVTYTNPNGAFLVCYNCHSYIKYGSIYVGTGLNTIGTPAGVQPHAGEYDQQGRCNGVGNTLPFNGYTTGSGSDGFSTRFTSLANTTPAPYAGEQAPDFGNIFGIQCLNCHNSGIGNAYGGIHGSANNTDTVNVTAQAIIGTTTVTGRGFYVDGMGNATKVERFLPGLGDAMHVPGTLGGFTSGTTGLAATVKTGVISNDTNWEQKFWQQTLATNFDLTGKIAPAGTSAGAGCYTLGTSTAATSALRGPSVTGAAGAATTLLDTWGGCEDHGAAQGGADHGFVKAIVRPVTY